MSASVAVLPSIVAAPRGGVTVAAIGRAPIAALLFSQDVSEQTTRCCATNGIQGVALGQHGACRCAQTGSDQRVVVFAAVCCAPGKCENHKADGRETGDGLRGATHVSTSV